MTDGPQLVLPVLPGPALVAGPVFVCFECGPLPRKPKRNADGVLVVGDPVVPFNKKHCTRAVQGNRFRKAFVQEYDDPESARWKEILKGIALRHMRGRPPSPRPIALLVHAFRPVPESWSRRDRELALLGGIRPTPKPDDDNYLKIRDALNGVVWIDDAQCVDSHVLKFYSERPGLRIEVREFLEPGHHLLQT